MRSERWPRNRWRIRDWGSVDGVVSVVGVGGRWMLVCSSAVEEFGPVVDVVSDCGFSGAVEFASVGVCGFIMLCMSALAPAAFAAYHLSHVHARRTQTGPARRSSRGKLCVPLLQQGSHTVHCPPKPFGCGGDAAGSPRTTTAL